MTLILRGSDSVIKVTAKPVGGQSEPGSRWMRRALASQWRRALTPLDTMHNAPSVNPARALIELSVNITFL